MPIKLTCVGVDGGKLDELQAEAVSAGHPSHAPLEQIVDSQATADSRLVESSRFNRKGRMRGNDPNAGEARQFPDQILHETARHPRVVGRAGKILERQQGNRGVADRHDEKVANPEPGSLARSAGDGNGKKGGLTM